MPLQGDLGKGELEFSAKVLKMSVSELVTEALKEDWTLGEYQKWMEIKKLQLLENIAVSLQGRNS